MVILSCQVFEWGLVNVNHDSDEMILCYVRPYQSSIHAELIFRHNEYRLLYAHVANGLLKSEDRNHIISPTRRYKKHSKERYYNVYLTCRNKVKLQL